MKKPPELHITNNIQPWVVWNEPFLKNTIMMEYMDICSNLWRLTLQSKWMMKNFGWNVASSYSQWAVERLFLISGAHDSGNHIILQPQSTQIGIHQVQQRLIKQSSTSARSNPGNILQFIGMDGNYLGPPQWSKLGLFFQFLLLWLSPLFQSQEC